VATTEHGLFLGFMLHFPGLFLTGRQIEFFGYAEGTEFFSRFCENYSVPDYVNKNKISPLRLFTKDYLKYAQISFWILNQMQYQVRALCGHGRYS
jgi:hypothetical protein